MNDYAFYRLPDATEYHIIRGVAECMERPETIGGRGGFVLAPFTVAKDHPVVFIPATETDVVNTDSADNDQADGSYEERYSWDEAENRRLYHHDFSLVHHSLDDGTADKVVLARRLCINGHKEVDAVAVFHRACRRYPHQMVCLVSTTVSGTWLMATPEVLAEGSGQQWRTVALAGTMTTNGPWNAKNRREQHIVEEYVGNCLRRHATDVAHSAPRTVTAGGLFHLRTDFAFRLHGGEQALWKLVGDLSPTPAVCGLPKDRALEIILSSESADRRYYSGFCGPVAIDDATHLFVSLRCMEISGKDVTLYAGGGLLRESIEEEEWKETEAKLKTMKDVL